MSEEWAFKNFLDREGRNLIKAWLDSRDVRVKAKAKLNARIRHLSISDHSEWPRPWFQKLEGYEGVFEIKMIQQNIQYRPLGFFGPGQRQFTLVLGAIEVGNRITPPDAFRTAERRMKDVQENRNGICDHDFS
jgi:hypothetical protein